MSWDKLEKTDIEKVSPAVAEMNKEISKEQQAFSPTHSKPQNEKEIEDWLFDNEITEQRFVCLIMGDDGTGKSPLALSYLSDEDIKAGKRVVVIDLDGGNIPLITKYQKPRCEKLGRKVSDVFIVKNPQSEIITDDGVEIDYKATFDRIKGVVKLLKDKKFREEHNIKYVIFDGLTTALSHAENQMRVDKNLDASGGVSQRFWLNRNKLFKEALDSIKSLPISSFFIAHSDFIPTGNPVEEISNVKLKANAMMHQKIRCEKLFGKTKTTFKATILKSKYDIKQEGKAIVFGEVDTETGESKFAPEKVLEELL